MWNLQNETATAADVIDLVGVMGKTTCLEDVRAAARALSRRSVGMRVLSDRVVWIGWDALGSCGRPEGPALPWEGGQMHDAEPMPTASMGQRYGELCSIAHYASNRTTIGVRHRQAGGKIVDPSRVSAADKTALTRRKRELVARLKRSESELKTQNRLIKKHPKAGSRIGQAAILAASREMVRAGELEAEIAAIESTSESLAECNRYPEPGCSEVVDAARTIAKRAKPAEVAVKRAKSPTEEVQREIAQEHFLDMMRANSPGIRLPEVEHVNSSWAPDGPMQVSKYKKRWREVFDAIFWPAADAALKGEKYAETVARAASDEIYERLIRSNVFSVDLAIRKGALSVPQDPNFFPRSNPRRAKRRKK